MYTFINLLFVFGVVKLVADCSLSGADSSDQSFVHDGTNTCTLPGVNGIHTIGVGLTLTISMNTSIKPLASQGVVLSGKVTIIRVLAGNAFDSLTIQDIGFVYSAGVAQKDFPLVRFENGGLLLKSVVFGNSSIFTDVQIAPLRVKNSHLLNIEDCSFFKFKNDIISEDYNYGGVINADFFTSTESGDDSIVITVMSSKFIDNSIGTRGYGGAFVFSTYSERTVITIQNCEFTNCKSQYYAGAFDIYSEVNLPSITVKNCKFTDCTSGRDSGAIWIEMAAPGEIIDCNFTSCTALNDGGGIYLFDDYVVKGSNYTVKNCKFDGCISIGEASRSAAGAAIFVESTGWTQIESCSFDRCVTNAFHGHGGAISNVRLSFMCFTIHMCNFTGCMVDKDDSTNPTADDNDGGDGGAVSIKIELFNTIVISASKFINCSASNHGGSLDVEGGSLIVFDSVFFNSTAINGNGGSISTTGIIVTINTTTFNNSRILNPNAKGVEVYSVREIFHYGSGNTFACAGKNDVIYGDVSLDLVVCEGKEIKDLECSKGTHLFSPVRTLYSVLAVFLLLAGWGLFLF